ncbi:hypothetical protein B0A48_06346 [Cryoendolithus antarcticus]|uniref:C3H1-type domain-containing protein n=1 Tax=Cryoendolithus antarcticus TaxID=1507870 RepID=A0A1V8TAQ6_9PEZI|nr:hypothetical protein B0A48_06346 [Cryoendolithus antarcticus]
MDLLQYLVSPSKGVDSAHHAAVDQGDIRDASASDAEVDVLEDLAKALKDNPVGTDNPHPSSTHGKALGELGTLTDDLEDGEVFNNRSAKSLRKRGAKICFFTYHGLACKREAKDECANLHVVPEDGNCQEISTHWINRGVHEKACGLPLCPWRNGRHEPKLKDPEKSGRGASRDRARKSASAVRPVCPAARKRKRQPHRDEPTGPNATTTALSYDDVNGDLDRELVAKRTKVDYSDLYPNPPPFVAAQGARPSSCVPTNQIAEGTGATCFPWLHGKCRRKRCAMKHALKDPPKMVEPPPGYVHYRPCGLKWCPGDGEAKRERRQGDGRKCEHPERYFQGPGKQSDDGLEDIVPVEAKAGEQEAWFLEGFE